MLSSELGIGLRDRLVPVDGRELHERPADVGRDNVYRVLVRVSDGVNTDLALPSAYYAKTTSPPSSASNTRKAGQYCG